MSAEWYEFAESRPVKAKKFWQGNKGRRAVVLHVSEGTIDSLVGWFLGGSPTSAHFGIGPDGGVFQFVSVVNSAFANGASFKNGHWFDPQGNQIEPRWGRLQAGINPNWTTISIERAGLHSDHWTNATFDSHVRLLVWLAKRFPELAPYEPGHTLIGHADISPKSKPFCPGPHTPFAELAAAANEQLLGDDHSLVTAESPILAPPRATARQAARYMLAHHHGQYSADDISDIILDTYWEVCAAVGVDPVVAVAQMIHETGNLTSAASQRPRRNPAGIGVTRDGVEGLHFPSWKNDSIPAHIGRLLAYALTDEQATTAQRAIIATALGWRTLPAQARGSAQTLKQLGRAFNPSGFGWADPGLRYGERIAEYANAIVGQPEN